MMERSIRLLELGTDRSMEPQRGERSALSGNTTRNPSPLPVPTVGGEAPYHFMSRKQKWNLVILVSMAGAFSPLSSNIYFPAIHTISSDLSVSSTLVAQTITVYMVVQAIAPSLFAVFSDNYGRRLTFAVSLSVYTASNLALAFVPNFPVLMVLRGLQAAGSAATISISAGVIADIACPEERGGFMGTNAGVRMTGQAIGPVIGGALNSAWGFRSIFWLLLVLSVTVLVALLVFLPETQRSIAGNGGVTLTGFHKPLIYAIKTPDACADTSRPNSTEPRERLTLKLAVQPLGYMAEKDVAVLLAWGAVAYTAWSMVTSSTTTALLRGYPYLTDWQIGLCFIPNGLGCIAGSLVTGWLLDRSFKSAEANYKQRSGLGPEAKVIGRSDFPFVRARIRLKPYFSTALFVSLALYGPSFEFNDLRRHYGVNLVAPLGLQFLIAFTATAIFNINSTLLVDCFQKKPASATALNNLCRCLLGAAGVSAIQPLIDSVKIMAAFFVVTGILVLFTPLVWVEWKWGDQWRREREDKLALEESHTCPL